MRGRPLRWSVRFAATAILLPCLLLTPLACWGGTDSNEPNNDLQQATKLTSGRSAAGVIALVARPADIDIFSSEAPRLVGENRCSSPARVAPTTP